MFLAGMGAVLLVAPLAGGVTGWPLLDTFDEGFGPPRFDFLLVASCS